ncbi:MAG TPA: hypothetical protein DCO75_05900 [Fibrobacteres bacterium]|jgi:MoaA/NifB/PqqE/SkfB family radical SAM enzyme|nr:hypothetical protein [Fibrobacterota bacterium]
MPYKIPLKHKIQLALRLLRIGKGPRFASLFVTRKCNCACHYCKSIYQPHTDITLEQWKAIIDRLHEWGVRIFSLTGGEPLVRPDIADIVEYISVNKKSICWMISNFGKMDAQMIDRLSIAGMQFITCSFDSLEGECAKSDRSVLDLLSYAKQKGMIASTLTVITDNNLKQIPDMVKEVTGRGLMFDMGLFQHVGGAFSPSDKTLKPKSMDELKTVLETIKKYKLKTGLVSPSWTYLNENLILYDKMGWKCNSLRDSYLVVNNNGALMTCQEYADGPQVLEIKNLGDPLWRLTKNKTIAACTGCFYGCYYQKSNIYPLDVLLDAWSMFRL